MKPPPSRTPARFRLLYWPCFGAWPVAMALLLALPLAMWARREDRFPSTITCTSSVAAPAPQPWEASFGRKPTPAPATCFVHDVRGLGTVQLPCTSTAAALKSMLDDHDPFSDPLVYASRSGPAAADGRDDLDLSHGIDAATARSLVDSCASAPPSVAGARTLQILVVGRSDLPGVLILLGALGVATLSLLRRRVTVEIDPVTRLLHVIERGFVRERRTVIVSADAVRTIAVVAGATGFLSGRRVELACAAPAGFVPLTVAYAPLTYAVHEQAARRVRAYLEGIGAAAHLQAS